MTGSCREAEAQALEVEGLRTRFGAINAVDGISFSVRRGETLCIVGESGCGKSTALLSVMRLIPPTAGRVEEGAARIAGCDNILALDERAMCDIRGARIGMIFQEPMTSLNPIMRVGSQIIESLRRHRGMDRAAARARTIELLEIVGIADPGRRIDQYPHELSGGMRQRVMIAMALACDPAVIFADEPTTALDVTTQAKILALLARLQRQVGAGMVFITHDLRVVREIADRVCVMYAGVVVEEGEAQDVLNAPLHPYTQGLLAALARHSRKRTGERLPTIPGVVPNLASLPRGCRFQERCGHVHDRCRQAEPPLLGARAGETSRRARCWLVDERAQTTRETNT